MDFWEKKKWGYCLIYPDDLKAKLCPKNEMAKSGTNPVNNNINLRLVSS